MADVLFFHHAQGLTVGCLSFADELRIGGHVVHTPDLYEGKTFAELADGVAYAEEVGFETVVERGRRVAERLPNELVYTGLSLGVLPAQMLAQTRPGARGAVLISAAIPASAFDHPWPNGVPLQIHMMDGDELVREEGDLEAARDLVATIGSAELFLYPGASHLFVDDSLSGYDETAATVLKERVVDFLARVE